MTPYTLNINNAMFRQMRKVISIVILVAFISTSIKSPAYAQVVDPMPHMSMPGVMVHLSPEFTPAYLKGIVIHPENALKFDFIIYKGDKELTDEQKREEYTKLTKYFLASLAIPDDDQWVNLSPYEKDRIIKDDFGKTEMGRDLLAQDYMLKQITASLIYPEDNLGKKFWDKVYTEAQEQFGTTNIPVNTFNKVWILPDDALIYEKGNTAYVLKNHLRVMLEEDYLSLQKHSGIQSAPVNKTHSIASKIVKEIVLPELEREVNEGENFATVRQVYSGMLLATWYKHALKESLLSKIYADKAKVKGVDQDPKNNEQIYRQYLRAYKKGVFNYIKEDVDRYTNETIPRKYFSGGTESLKKAAKDLDEALFANLDKGEKGLIKETSGLDAEKRVVGQLREDDMATIEAEENVAKEEAPAVNPVNKQLKEYLLNLRNSNDNPVFYNTEITQIMEQVLTAKDRQLGITLLRQLIIDFLAKEGPPLYTQAQVNKILDGVDKILGQNDVAMTTATAMNIPVEEYANDFLAKNPAFYTIFGSSEQDAKVKLVKEFKAWASKPQEGTGKPIVLPKGDGFLASLFSFSPIGLERTRGVLYRVEPADHAMTTDAAMTASSEEFLKEKEKASLWRLGGATSGLIFVLVDLYFKFYPNSDAWTLILGIAAAGFGAYMVDEIKEFRNIKDLEGKTLAFKKAIEGYALDDGISQEDKDKNFREALGPLAEVLLKSYTPYRAVKDFVFPLLWKELPENEDLRNHLLGLVSSGVIDAYKAKRKADEAMMATLELRGDIPSENLGAFAEAATSFKKLVENEGSLAVTAPLKKLFDELNRKLRVDEELKGKLSEDKRLELLNSFLSENIPPLASAITSIEDIYQVGKVEEEKFIKKIKKDQGLPESTKDLAMKGELGLVEKMMQEAGFRRDERGEIPNLLTKLGVVNEDTRGDWVKLFKKANDPRESTSTSALEALTELFKVAQDWPQDVRTKMVSPNAIKKELDMFGIKPLLNGASWSIAVSDVINKAKDSAMKGGIDFNAANLNLQIKRDGNGVPLPISQQDLENINIDGLVPIIIDIQPAASLPIFSELQSH